MGAGEAEPPSPLTLTTGQARILVKRWTSREMADELEFDCSADAFRNSTV